MSGSITLRGVSKVFGDKTALETVDLEIATGELISVLGASGSGKSTLIKMIAGLEQPTTGRVLVDDKDITHLPPRARGLSMVAQDYALFPHMTVTENVAFGLRVRRTEKAARQEKVRRMLELVSLAEYGERRPHQLSGGQRQRVALARALAVDPAVLLLDEPFGALDQDLRERLQLEYRAIQRKLGITTIFITHDQREAFTLADRILVLEDGRLLQLDTPDGIYNRPANLEVVQRIGQANLLPGVVEQEPGGQLVVTGVVGPGISIDNGRAGAGDEAVVAIRPERIRLVPAGTDWCAPATVHRVQYLGDQVCLHLVLDGSRTPVRVLTREEPVGDGSLSEGSTAHVSWRAGDCHVFPGKTAPPGPDPGPYDVDPGSARSVPVHIPAH